MPSYEKVLGFAILLNGILCFLHRVAVSWRWKYASLYQLESPRWLLPDPFGSGKQLQSVNTLNWSSADSWSL